MNIQEVIARALPVLQGEPTVIAAYLFGSLAAGNENPMSDIDIAVLLSRKNPRAIAALTRKLTVSLSEALDSMVVDLVCLNGADLAMRYSATSEGILIYERNATKRIQFETEMMYEYFDMLPLWSVYDHYKLMRMRGGSEH